MSSIKNAYIKFWYTLILVANQKNDSDAELVVLTSNGTYIGKPVSSSELETDFVNQAWEMTFSESKTDKVSEEISLIHLKNVRTLDNSESYGTLTIFAEDVLGVSGNGDLTAPSDDCLSPTMSLGNQSL